MLPYTNPLIYYLVIYLVLYPTEGLVLRPRGVPDVVGHVPQVHHHGAHLEGIKGSS